MCWLDCAWWVGPFGKFEGIICLSSDAPITLPLSSFFPHIIIWPPGKREWESNLLALFKVANKDIKCSVLGYTEPVIPEIDNRNVKSWPWSVSALWLNKSMNMNARYPHKIVLSEALTRPPYM